MSGRTRILLFAPPGSAESRLRRPPACAAALHLGHLWFGMDTAETILVKHFCVEGRVQGVGFRWFVHREAAALGLRGWVRNTVNSAVEVVAAGSPSMLSQLRTALEQGSRGSRVDRVNESELPPSQADTLGAFTIEGAW